MTHCRGAFSVALEKRVAGEWTSVWSPAIPACLSRPPIVIDPGGTFRDTLHVRHAAGDDVAPEIRASDLEGVYRIVIPAASRLSSPERCGDQQLPKEERVSNPFRVRRE